jgi:HK97 gp10 family phage protein
MAIYSADVEGLDELIRDFQKLPRDAINHVTKASNEAAQIIAADAIAKAPKDTGILAKMIRIGKVSIRLAAKGYVRARVYIQHSGTKNKSGASHGTPLELGHKMVLWGKRTGDRVEAKPFMRPAADENKQRIRDLQIRALNNALDEFGRKGG